MFIVLGYVAQTVITIIINELNNYFQATYKVEKDNLNIGSCEDGEIVRTRTYDLHITYDKYYQTPRLWLFGYDEVNVNSI